MGNAKSSYSRPRVIFVDVDGTLLHAGGGVDFNLVDWLRSKKADGFNLVLWSARGERYAAGVANDIGIADLFDHIVSKPGYIVDDLGWSWIKYTKSISSIPRFFKKKGE